MVSGDFKDISRIIACDKALCDKAFILPKIQNMMDISVDLSIFIHHDKYKVGK